MHLFCYRCYRLPEIGIRLDTTTVHTADNGWCAPSSSCSLQSHLVVAGMAGSTVKKPWLVLCTIVCLYFLWKCDSSLYCLLAVPSYQINIYFGIVFAFQNVSKGSNSVNKMEDKKYQQKIMAYIFMTFLVVCLFRSDCKLLKTTK